MPARRFNSDFYLGLGGIIAGCVILFVWIPLDVDTGLVEKVRGQIKIGDAMAPTLAAGFLILGGLLTMFQSFRFQGRINFNLNWTGMKFLALTLILLAISLAIMRWAGPFSAQFFAADYRSLRATIPWKYTGFFLGGGFMIFSLISLMEKQMRWRIFILSILAVAAIMLIYDLPFENLLLPPNGDI